MNIVFKDGVDEEGYNYVGDSSRLKVEDARCSRKVKLIFGSASYIRTGGDVEILGKHSKIHIEIGRVIAYSLLAHYGRFLVITESGTKYEVFSDGRMADYGVNAEASLYQLVIGVKR